MGELYGSAVRCRSYSVLLFALYYQSNGQYDEAEGLYKRALADNEEKLGLDYPDTLRTIENLSLIKISEPTRTY